MSRIYNSKDLFQLEEEYSVENKEKLDQSLKIFYEMKFASFLRQDEIAMTKIDTLLLKHNDVLTQWFIRELILDKAFFLSRNGQNGSAADYIKNNLKLITNQSDSLTLINSEKEYNEIRYVPCPEIIREKKTTTLYYTLKTYPKGSLYMVPVTIKGKTYKFIYDICGGNTALSISENMIKELGIKIRSKGYVYGGSLGRACLNATIDSLIVGDIVFRNPWLHISIVPDSVGISGILGNDFMNLIGSFSIYPKKQKIVFPYQVNSPTKKHNMMYGRGLYFLQAFSGNEKILFTLDSGSPASLALAPYYLKHKEWFDSNGVKDTSTVTEAAGKHFQEFLRVKSMPISVGKTTVEIKNMLVFPNMNFDAFGQQQGVLGTIFFECFRKVTVNFKDMNVDVKK